MTDIIVTKKIKHIHPVIDSIVKNLAEIDKIQFIRLSPDFLRASSERDDRGIKNPITKVGHPTAVGVSLILDVDYNDIQFFEMTSATKGYGEKMVDAVMKDLPEGWSGVIVMDWSGGFWDKMKKKHRNLVIL